MKVAELSPLDRHLRVVRTIGAHRPSVPDYAAYERMKADLARDFPDLEPADYQRAIRLIAAAAGV